MKSVVLAINEEDLTSLSLEVLDYADRISEIFDKIDACMDKVSSYYQGSPCSALIEFYKEVVPYYSIIKNNIVSYSDDFIALIRKMQDNDKTFASLFQEYTNETVSEMKAIQNRR